MDDYTDHIDIPESSASYSSQEYENLEWVENPLYSAEPEWIENPLYEEPGPEAAQSSEAEVQESPVPEEQAE